MKIINNKRAILLCIICSFIYGIGVGKYHIFPSDEILEIKGLLFHDEPKIRTSSHSYYLDKKSFFELNAQASYDVVFIGDSITDRAEWSDLFPGIKISNRGISGDTTTGVLNRMDTIINSNVSKAFIMLGINDVGNISVDTIFSNYVKIIEILINEKITVFIQSTLFTDGRDRDNNIVKDLNNRLVEWSKANDVQFIDLNIKLSVNGVLDEQLSNDGLHLNGEGYKIWANIIKTYIDSE